ncbi:lysylphosphatidylglycerol synthase transmembrane domain-containing protein [Amygdalobacter nucleatus]|uniref:lysylphosphatidylglycerol synthase transmembrane domain-containing protein n=1 Tax=Amygdalobacter nucleatus TaxID=3029274 RepID=UPI0027AB8A3C|nr:lysylphosphatidylglycerol synthase transmembrane domain-containing protein [Amygdalobacter nucleatus]WEG37481.1 lysylphosphatidylglycerol synthase transmembrane domain-containing protein [Amygdalobacter nucleatus]
MELEDKKQVDNLLVEDSDNKAKERGTSTRNLLFGLLILIVMLFLTWRIIFTDYSFDEMLTSLQSANWHWLLLGFLMMLIHQICIALSIVRVLKYIAPKVDISNNLAICTSFIGFFFNNITPSSSGGQPMQMYYMKKRGIAMSYTSVVFIALAIFYNLAMLFYCALVNILRFNYVKNNLGYVSYLLPLGYLLYIVTTTFLIVLFFNPMIIVKSARSILNFLIKYRLVKRPKALLAKLLHFSKRYVASSLNFNKNWRLIWELAGLHLIQLAAYTSVPFFAAMALKDCMTTNKWQLFLDTFTMQAILNISASLIPSPGAVGLTEGNFLRLFTNIVGDKQVLTTMLLTRLVNLYVFLLIATVITIICFVKPGIYAKRDGKSDN